MQAIDHLMSTQTTSLAEQWKALSGEEPQLRIRDAAARLGVSEAELLATRVGAGVLRLQGDWRDFIKALPGLGRVLCLTRNEHAVHERHGVFREIGFFGPPPQFGNVVGPDIDLRLFLAHWHVGFAVEDKTKEGTRRSFQIFDASGTAVHKVYLLPESNEACYLEITERFLAEDQSTTQEVTPAPEPQEELPDSEIDRPAYEAEWLALKDTHHFFRLLDKYKVSREQALRLAPEGYAWRVKLDSTEKLLRKASESKLPIMVFVGNPGCIQIHTGLTENIKWFGDNWLNVLDEEFSMHLKHDKVASAWVVRKPTQEEGVGYITSMEIFDANGENIALFFGKRKPNELECEAWRELAFSLEKEVSTEVA